MTQNFFFISRLNGKSLLVRTLVASLFTSLVVACHSDNQVDETPQLEVEFVERHLDGLIANRVLAADDGIYVATDKGVYKSVDQFSWELISTQDWDVKDIIELDTSHLMVSVIYRGTNQLNESFDGGLSWHQIRTSFGPGRDGRFDTVNRLFWDENAQTLFASGVDVLAKSYDRGASWELVSGIWNSFGSGIWAIAYSAEKDTVFYGGQGAIENPILRRVDLTQASEKSFDLTDLLPAPSTIREIQFDTDNADTVYASGEGGIVASTDLGENWVSILSDNNSRFYFDFVKDERFSNHIYTAGWNKVFDDPQPLIVEVSLDNGASWQQFLHPDPDIFGGVRSMDIVYEEEQAFIYLGLYKGGVMKVLIK